MALFDSMSKGGDGLSMLVKFAGAKVVHDTMSSLATKGECVESVGRALYNEESDDAVKSPWERLSVKQKQPWTNRARVAILGLRDYVTNRPT
jgi:hypothetical protein